MKSFSSPLRIIALVLGLIFLGLLALLFAFRNAIGPFSHDMLYVPDYPGAQQVQVWTKPNSSDWFSWPEPYKRVTFVTSDTPAQVFTFYKDKFRSRSWFEDWRVDTPLTTQSGDRLEIVGFGCEDVSAPIYVVIVRTKTHNGSVQVTVERSAQPGM
jgi:hypothetical protein